jgi:energy-coupling factor transporter ATP-binding protein EcfA2
MNTAAPAAAPAIELKGISKAFGPVQANKDISMSVAKGAIHGIVGENGAGKSTLMSILYGFYKADAGEIFINGAKDRDPRQPGRDPRRHRDGAPALQAGRELHRCRKRHPRGGGRGDAQPLHRQGPEIAQGTRRNTASRSIPTPSSRTFPSATSSAWKS